MIAIPSTMKKPLLASAIMHATIVIVVILGLPAIKPDPIMIEPINAINIEFAALDEITQTNKPPKPPIPEPAEEKPTPPPEMSAETPPDLSQTPPPPEIEEKQPEAEPETVPLPEEIKTPPKTAKPFPKKPKPPKTITRKAPDEPKRDFQSLLKNLAAEEPDDTSKNQDTPSEGIEDSPATNLADKLTFSEIDAVKAQLAGCWNVLSGAKYAENLIVAVKLHMNPDRTVRKAVIIDQGQYNRDSHFRAAADSALRALRNPRCSPLRLPADKYDEWKTTIIRFDPSEML